MLYSNRNKNLILALLAITMMTVPLLFFSSIFSEQLAPALIQKNRATTSNATLYHTLGNNSVEATSNSDFLIYENSTFGIKIQYPSDWLKNTTARCHFCSTRGEEQ
ncbi:MAG TPA: hypothetical protein VFJ51_03940 [Nitrososphaeraceae archaeon]|nr:hypothetical protein [Nitrososphaeraceae archaeon]